MAKEAEFKCDLTQPCNECPFLEDSVPGYLGPWKPTSLHLFVMGEKPFACHKTINDLGKPVQVCAGSMLYRRKHGKLARTTDPIFDLEALFFDQVEDPSTEKILGFKAFKEHHLKAENIGTI